MKKYFLKGKELFNKKEQKDNQHTKQTTITQQIPKKLQSTFKILSNNHLDLEPLQKHQLYYRINANHSIGYLLHNKIKQQTKVLEPDYIEDIKQHKNKIGTVDEELQQNAYKLRKIIEEYHEDLPDNIDDLLGIGVVQFHHKRGAQVQFVYPKNEDTKTIFNSVIPFAMPDSSHNKMQDCSMFNLPFEIAGQTKMVYGISYFKQIKITQEMRQKDQALTRSHLQKSVCILSFVPLFGQLKNKVMQITNKYFQNLADFSSITDGYNNLKQSLQLNWKNISLDELHVGIDCVQLLLKFKLGLFKIYKSILYSKRVIFYSQSSFTSSSAILSILSLFPGQLIFSMRSHMIDKYVQGLRQYALPLKLFSNDQPLILSANIQILTMLKTLTDGFVIGTSNLMLIQSLKHDLLVDLDKNIIKADKQQSTDQELFSKQDKSFVQSLVKIINNSSVEQTVLRDIFHSYLKKSLIKISNIKHGYKQFINKCLCFQQTKKSIQKQPKTKGKSYKNYSSFDEDIKIQNQLSIKAPIIDSSLIQIPLLKLIHKSHFRYFLEFSSPTLYLLSNHHYCQDVLTIDKYQYYLGSMPVSKSKYIIYDFHSKELKICNLYSDQKTKVKDIKFNQEGKIKQIFIGDFDGDKYNGHGFMLNSQSSYEGNYINGEKDGFGRLVSPLFTYIGTFYQGLFQGDGHLIMNQQKTLYVGTFKKGLKQGVGKLQTPIYYYEGQFLQNEMNGSGSIKITQSQIKIYGSFSKNKLTEGSQSVISYPNGDVYTGTILNFKPHGKGSLQTLQGQITQGQFFQGQFKSKNNSQISL